MKHIVIPMVLCLLAIACGGSSSFEKPKNLISEEKMSNILYDLYIINGAKGIDKKVLEAEGFVPETFILTKYNIDSTQFANSNAYYTFNTDVYKVIVEDVKARLEKQKEIFEEIRTAEALAAKKKRDSIKEAAKKDKDTVKTIKMLKKAVVMDSLAKT